MGFSLRWLLLLPSMGSRACGLQLLTYWGLVALWHVKSFWTGDQTWVPCIGRWILNHWTTKEVLYIFKYNFWGKIISFELKKKIYLAAPDQLCHVGSSSLTRNRTWAPCLGNRVLATEESHQRLFLTNSGEDPQRKGELGITSLVLCSIL